jgi:hypothetical protein
VKVAVAGGAAGVLVGCIGAEVAVGGNGVKVGVGGGESCVNPLAAGEKMLAKATVRINVTIPSPKSGWRSK